MCTLSQTHNFSSFSFTNIKIQICTSRQTHDFSSLFFITQYKFKSVLRTKAMVFLPISNLYFAPNPGFFCLFPYKPIQIQICTSHQTQDFFAYFRYEIMGYQMCTLWQTHNFFAFSLTNIRIQIGTLCQTHHFSSSFYINLYKFKYVLHTKLMIILLISNMYFVSDPWFFCLLPNKSIQIQICTSRPTHHFFPHSI